MLKALVFIFVLAAMSCTNSVVDMSSNSSFGTATLSVVGLSGNNLLSQNQSPVLQLTSFYPDVLTSQIAIYEGNGCIDPSGKLGLINNSIGATLATSILVEGAHHFSYKPVYEKQELNNTAPCINSGLTYTVDTTALPPNITLLSYPLSSSQTVTLNVDGCENSPAGTSSIKFQESATFIGGANGWQSCTSSVVFTVSATAGYKNIYAFIRDPVGNISAASAPVYFHLSAATVNFGTDAGPGNVLGGFTYVTKLNALVSGDFIDKYRFVIGQDGVVDCTNAVNYGSETNTTVKISAELSTAASGISDGAMVKLCVIGRDNNLNWQNVSEATTVRWVKNVLIQDLSMFTNGAGGPRSITMDNLKVTDPYAISRTFIHSGPGSVSAYCSNCSFDVNGSNTFITGPSSLATGDKVRIKIMISGTYLSTTPASFTFSTTTIPINNRTEAPLASFSEPRIFISRNTRNGNFSGLPGANAFCSSEAGSYPPGPGKQWMAMLSSSGTSGINRLIATGNHFRDARDGREIFNGSMFISSFYHFIDGSPTNGGGADEWQYIANAPRANLSNPFWYGNDYDCNCNDWTSTAANASCSFLGQATSGLLTYGSGYDFYTNFITAAGYAYVKSCSEPQHVICFEN